MFNLVTKEEVLKALSKIYDPEIPVNIVDLGLIYDIKIKDGDVHIKMTLTVPSCPMYMVLEQWVKAAVKEIKGVNNVTVEFVWDPPWTPDRMSPKAKALLGFI